MPRAGYDGSAIMVTNTPATCSGTGIITSIITGIMTGDHRDDGWRCR